MRIYKFTKHVKDKRVEVELKVEERLDDYDQLHVEYRFDGGEWYFARDYENGAVKFWRPHEIHGVKVKGVMVPPDVKRELDELKSNLLAERERLYREYVSQLVKGEKLCVVYEVGCDWKRLRLYPLREWEEKLGTFRAYRALEAAASFDIMSMNLDEKRFSDGQIVSIYDVAGDKIEKLRKMREEIERRKAERAKLIREGWTFLAVNRCWECGGLSIVGELDVNGNVVRMSSEKFYRMRNLLRQAVELQYAADSEGGKRLLSSIGTDVVEKFLEEHRVKLVIVSEEYDGC